MSQVATPFVTTFTSLLAIINPPESLPVFLRLLQGKDRRSHRLVARRACTYATSLLFMRIGFSLLMPSAGAGSAIASARMAQTGTSPSCRWRCR